MAVLLLEKRRDEKWNNKRLNSKILIDIRNRYINAWLINCAVVTFHNRQVHASIHAHSYFYCHVVEA